MHFDDSILKMLVVIELPKCIAAEFAKLRITRCWLIYHVNSRLVLVLLRVCLRKYHASEKRQERKLI